MKKFIFLAFLVTYICATAYAASILDYLTIDDVEARDGNNKKTCLCTGPSCICCVDFNMSLIDLGGPGCVRLKYLGVEEGVALNVSYGDSLLHSNTVRSPDPEPTCLNIFSRLAQMCAKFTKLVRNDGGLQGCVHLEPMLLEEVQLELPIGCFDMNADGMKEIVPPVKEAQGQDKEVPQVASANQEASVNLEGEGTKNVTVEEADAILEGISALDIISAVSETADQGISMLSKWLGLKLSSDANATAS